MISDLDIYRAANLVIKRHRGDAVIEVARMVDRMLELGDLEGRDLWRRTRRAIEALQAPPRVMASPQPCWVRARSGANVALFSGDPASAAGFVARFCASKVQITEGAFQIRHDEPAQRVPLKAHRTP